ncbi:MAG: acyl transferase [Bacteroidia bacterium]
MRNSFKKKVFLTSATGFNDLALELFYYQAKYNSVYAKFLQLIDVRPENILEIDSIPYLPIDFFKDHNICCQSINDQTKVFTSSSTSGLGLSHHYVPDIELYHKAFIKSFEYQFGNIEDYTFRFLLPSYLERKGSSLVYMADKLLKISGKGGFYLNNLDKLAEDIIGDKKSGSKVILLGVSFALIDFAENYPMDLSRIIILETGGMKGRKKEITRNELHDFLMQKFNTTFIGSEYGMTELLSQAYSIKDGIFNCPPWMKISIGQTTDPFTMEKKGKTGNLKIIDLANIDSCSFISTSDLGRLNDDGSFEVLGRFDNSDVRGCNLLIAGTSF